MFEEKLEEWNRNYNTNNNEKSINISRFKFWYEEILKQLVTPLAAISRMEASFYCLYQNILKYKLFVKFHQCVAKWRISSIQKEQNSLCGINLFCSRFSTKLGLLNLHLKCKAVIGRWAQWRLKIVTVKYTDEYFCFHIFLAATINNKS